MSKVAAASRIENADRELSIAHKVYAACRQFKLDTAGTADYEEACVSERAAYAMLGKAVREADAAVLS